MKILFVFFLVLASCQAEPQKTPELGTVKWSRDLAASLDASKKSGKPIFLLFQEVPG